MVKKATREAYGEALAQLVKQNPDIVVLDADLAGSTKTSEAKKVCPQRHFDMGIAECKDMCNSCRIKRWRRWCYSSM